MSYSLWRLKVQLVHAFCMMKRTHETRLVDLFASKTLLFKFLKSEINHWLRLFINVYPVNQEVGVFDSVSNRYTKVRLRFQM